MLESIDREYLVLFFDESSVHPENFRKRAWGKCGRRVFVSTTKGYPGIHILSLVSMKGLETIQLFSSSNSLNSESFLRSSLKYLQKKYHNNEMVILLDNAKCNHSPHIHHLTEEFNLVLLFNGVSSPQLNSIEYFFEFLKRGLRRHLSLSKLEIIQQLLQRARLFTPEMMTNIWDRQHIDFQKVIKGQPLFYQSWNEEEW